MHRRFRPKSLTLPLLLLLGGVARGDDAENVDRIRSYPPERRAQLASALAAFDALKPEEKAAVRDLDEKIAALPDDETRAAYLDVLRRYHLWRRTITEADRKRLDEATPETRVRLVNEMRRAQLARARADLAKPDWVQLSTLNDVTLFWAAIYLKIWFVLTPEERESQGKIENREERFKRLLELGRKHRILQSFQNFREEFIVELEKAAGNREERIPKATKPAAPGAAAKKAQRPAVRSTPNPLTRKAEANLLHEHPPAPVDRAHLAQFEEECPNWLRESLELLPPDAARRRMTILYRLVFPPPAEISIPKPKPAPKAKGPQSPGPL